MAPPSRPWTTGKMPVPRGRWAWAVRVARNENIHALPEARRADEKLAGGVSPGEKGLMHAEPRRGDRKRPMSHTSSICHVVFSIAPSGLHGSGILPFPGAHAPGYRLNGPSGLTDEAQ